MAGYGGFFLKGMAGGLQSGFEMRWKKKQQKQLEAKEKEVAEAVSLFNNQIKMYGEDKKYTDDEISMINTAWLSLGADAQELTKGAKEAIVNMNEADMENTIQLLDNFKDGLSMVDPKNAKELYEFARKNAKSEKALNYINAQEKMNEAKYKAPVETYSTPQGVQGANAGAGYEYNKDLGGYLPTYQKETAPKEPTTEERKLDWAIDSYNKGLIKFEELKKYMGTYIAPTTPEKATALEEKIKTAKNLGATNEEIKKMVLGGGATDKVTDPEGILFGINGIMKDYINSGSQLGEEQKKEIRNNYDIIKPSLDVEANRQVVDYLQQIGINVNTPIKNTTTTAKTPQPGLLQKGVNAVKGWLGQKGGQGVSPTGNVASSTTNQTENKSGVLYTPEINNQVEQDKKYTEQNPDSISAIQSALKEKGYWDYAITGEWTIELENALRELYRDQQTQ